MRSLKSLFGVAGALVPIGYCGYLLYYFLDLSGSVEEVKNNGLGPTVLGLGVVAALFCIPLIFKIMRLFRGPGSPRSGGDAPKYDDGDDDDGGAAAEAAIARYMARKSAESATTALAPRPAQQSGGPAKRPSFGRKT
jgi:hypothetical protein